MEDYPKTLFEFEQRFATEEACLDYLFKLRWTTILTNTPYVLTEGLRDHVASSFTAPSSKQYYLPVLVKAIRGGATNP